MVQSTVSNQTLELKSTLPRQYFAYAQEIEVDCVFLARALTLSFRFCFWWVFDLRGSFRTPHLRNVCSLGD